MLKANNELTIVNALELGEDISDEAKGKGRRFTSRFIEAGLAHYKEYGDILITKETLDKFVHTMVGCPVIINHKDITDKNVDKERVGVVSKVWYSEFDGWYWCEGIIWDAQAIDLIKNQGWSVSCTYDFKSDFQPSTYHGKKVDCIFTDGEFLHLALVANPRYEKANIVLNSQDEEITYTVENEKWITIHPHGGEEDEDGKKDYRRIKLEDGETPKEAIERTYGKKDEKREKGKELNQEYREAQRKHLKTYSDFEKGIGTMEDLEKADIELKKATDKYNKSFDDLEKVKEESKKDKKDLLSDENFAYQANRIKEEYINGTLYGSYSENVDRLLKKFNKTDKDFDKVTGVKEVGKEKADAVPPVKKPSSVPQQLPQKKDDRQPRKGNGDKGDDFKKIIEPMLPKKNKKDLSDEVAELHKKYYKEKTAKVTLNRFNKLFPDSSLEDNQFRITKNLSNIEQVTFDKKRNQIIFYELGDLADSKDYNAPKNTNGLLETFRTDNYNKLIDYLIDKRKEEYRLQANNEIEKEITMSVLNELECFIKNIVDNACKKEEEIIEDEKLENKEEAIEDKKEDDKEEKEEKFEEEKEIAENKCKNEEKEETEEKEEEKKVENSMEKVNEILNGSSEYKSDYVSRKERLELGNKY